MIINLINQNLPVNAAIVEIDIDPAAERYAVLNRLSFETIWFGIKPSSGIAKIVVPIAYGTSNNLMALILDDTGSPSYYVTGNDKVQAQLVDARTVTLNP